MNDYNNTIRSKKQNAMKGFKTFIVTLSISMVVFSSIYYLLDNSSNKVDIEDFGSDEVALNTKSNGEEKGNVKGAKSSLQNSPFAEIGSKSPAVLAETTTNEETVVNETDTTEETGESTESAVPSTGSNTLVGTVLSATLFSIALYLVLVGPRKTALSAFENSMLKEED